MYVWTEVYVLHYDHLIICSKEFGLFGVSLDFHLVFFVSFFLLFLTVLILGSYFLMKVRGLLILNVQAFLKDSFCLENFIKLGAKGAKRSVKM